MPSGIHASDNNTPENAGLKRHLPHKDTIKTNEMDRSKEVNGKKAVKILLKKKRRDHIQNQIPYGTEKRKSNMSASKRCNKRVGQVKHLLWVQRYPEVTENQYFLIFCILMRLYVLPTDEEIRIRTKRVERETRKNGF
ncbi:MAG: hypothetical protein GY866_39095 [Proteobacteria bacterium]|nr:hypothetical protein [Pseudomonadota bacterium]